MKAAQRETVSGSPQAAARARQESDPAAERSGEQPAPPAGQQFFLQAVDLIAADAVERHMPQLPPKPPEK